LQLRRRKEFVFFNAMSNKTLRQLLSAIMFRRAKLMPSLTVLVFALQFPIAVSAQEPKSSSADNRDGFQQALDNGNQLLRQGRIDDALNEFRRAAKLRDDKCAECFQRIGQIYLQLQRLKESAAALRQAAELKPPNEAEMYNILGVVLYLQNEKQAFEDAVIALQRSIELSKGKVVKAYYNLGFALIKSGKEQEGVAVLKQFLERDPGATEASQARAVIANVNMVDAKVAPTFVVKSHTGEDLALEKFKGKVVLLDFWASWCVPCRVDMPEVRKIWKQYGGDRFAIIGINLDSNRALFEAYMKEEGITWVQYYDGLGWGNKISRLYGVYAIPHTVLIDQDGVIKAIGLRGDGLAARIGELMAAPPKNPAKTPASK
jgi:tetratricopeptide (TPR) repeat protein